MTIKVKGNYFVDECVDQEGNIIQEECCYNFSLDKIIKVIPENPESNELVFSFVRNGGKKVNIRMKIAELVDYTNLKGKLLSRCFWIGHGYDKLFTAILNQKFKDLIESDSYEYEHKCLGWQEIEGKKLFLYDTKLIEGNHISTCVRKAGKFCDGNETVYDAMLNNHVLNNRYMSLAYILGFTGCLNSRISRLSDTGTMFVSLSGKSSSGKSTALKLIASIWGDTDQSKGKLIIKNTSTEVGRENQIAGLYGVPILLDDINVGFKGDISNFIYRIASGEPRTVAKPDGELDHSRLGFSGIAVSTSEQSVYDYTSGFSGIYARVLDLNSITWTKDGSDSVKIKEVISNNYGFKGKKFGEYLEQFDDDYLKQIHSDVVDKLRIMFVNKDSYTDRVLNQYATIISTLRLVNSCFNLTINEDDIINILIKNENELIKTRDIGQASYEAVYEYYLTHKNLFVNHPKMTSLKWDKQYYGVATITSNEVTLSIPCHHAKKILRELGFNQIQICINSWLDKGYLMHEKGRKDISNQSLGRHYKLVYLNKGDESNDN